MHCPTLHAPRQGLAQQTNSSIRQSHSTGLRCCSQHVSPVAECSGVSTYSCQAPLPHLAAAALVRHAAAGLSAAVRAVQHQARVIERALKTLGRSRRAVQSAARACMHPSSVRLRWSA